MVSDKMKKKNNLIKQVLKTSCATIVIYVGLTAFSKTGVLDNALLKLDKDFSQDRRIEMMQEVEEATNIDSEDNENIILLHAVIQNDKLENWEKNILYGFDEIIKENPHIQLRSAYKILETIDIKYIDRPKEYAETVYGIYSPSENVVYMFNDAEGINLDILKHELIHAILNNKSYDSLPKYFIEGTTELLANEYFSNKPFAELCTYPYEVAIVELLCDMVGSDKVLEAYTKGDMNIISKELSKTLGISDSTKLLRNIDRLFEKFKDGKKIDQSDIDEIMSKISKYLASQYEQTNDETIPEKFFYSKRLLENMLKRYPYDSYLFYIQENGVYAKPYFSSKLKEKYPTVKRINTNGTAYKGEDIEYSFTLIKEK